MSDDESSGESTKWLNKRPLGSLSVSPIGLGAMQLAGPNVFGPPESRSNAVALLREAVDLGVDHIDTAYYYGPAFVNEIIREALFPYPAHLVLVSKVGAQRGRKGEIFADDEPSRLRSGIEDNLRTLGVDRIAVVNLRLMRDSPPDAFFDDQLQAMISARDDGLIGAVGLSNVTVAHLRRALQLVDIACVQNQYHPGDRRTQPVLDECRQRGAAFVPFAPLGFGSSSLLKNPTVARVAERCGCTPAQVCLAWELAIAPNVLLIPGTSSISHLQQNAAVSQIHLDADAISDLSQI
jgi:pyridoxine 4-dehydrogenase